MAEIVLASGVEVAVEQPGAATFSTTPPVTKVLVFPGGGATAGGGVTAHGSLSGLDGDDHPQYHDDTRGDTRYYTQAQVDTSLAAKETPAGAQTKADAAEVDANTYTDSTVTAHHAASSTDHDDRYYTQAQVDAEKGQPSGVATLDASGRLVESYDAALADTGVFPVARIPDLDYVKPGDLVVNVKDFGAVGDGVADDTAAILEAVTAAGQTGTLFFPRGTYSYSATIVGVKGISGEGRARTVLDYTGTDSAIRLAVTLGTRTFHGHVHGFLLRKTGGGAAVGIDVESHSVGMFTHVAVEGFATGFWLRSTVEDGGCLYNTFLHCEAVTPGIGWLIDTESSNENRLIACRTNGATDAAVVITHGNHNHLISCAFESGVDGVRIDGGTSSDGNVIAFCRFEMNSDQAIVVGTGVRDTLLVFPKVMSTGGTILDNGLRTKHLVGLPSDAHVAVERNKDMGADTTTPVFAARDVLASVGSPTTFEIQNERFGGTFVRGVRGGTERFAINAEGVIRPFAAATASLPSPSRAGAGGMAYDTTTNQPAWSDGVAWRYADGTLV